jgi:hypothetical protein
MNKTVKGNKTDVGSLCVLTFFSLMIRSRCFSKPSSSTSTAALNSWREGRREEERGKERGREREEKRMEGQRREMV